MSAANGAAATRPPPEAALGDEQEEQVAEVVALVGADDRTRGVTATLVEVSFTVEILE